MIGVKDRMRRVTWRYDRNTDARRGELRRGRLRRLKNALMRCRDHYDDNDNKTRNFNR